MQKIPFQGIITLIKYCCALLPPFKLLKISKVEQLMWLWDMNSKGLKMAKHSHTKRQTTKASKMFRNILFHASLQYLC